MATQWVGIVFFSLPMVWLGVEGIRQIKRGEPQHAWANTFFLCGMCFVAWVTIVWWLANNPLPR